MPTPSPRLSQAQLVKLHNYIRDAGVKLDNEVVSRYADMICDGKSIASIHMGMVQQAMLALLYI